MVLGDVDGVPSTPQTGPNKGYKTWGEPLLSQSGLLSSAGSEAICFLPSSPPGIAKIHLVHQRSKHIQHIKNVS